jgi:AcrR family transcriptional regulator
MEDSPRGRLLSGAAALFRDKGYERTTVRDIAAAVGIQSGSIFHHFPSKDALLYAVIEEVIRVNTERLRQAILQEDSAEGRLRALIHQELVFIVGDTREAMSVMVQEWRSLSPEQQRDALGLRQVYEDIWLEVLGELHAAGRFACTPFVMRRLITGMNSWAHNWFDPQRDLSLQALADIILARVVGERQAGEPA